MKRRPFIHKIVLTIVFVHLIGCTTLHPVETGPDELHYKIRNENVVNTHDWVRIITEDEKEYRFQVTEIDDQVIRGDDVVNNTEVSVPIDNIVAIETQDFSIGKTSLLVGSTVVFLYMFVIPALAIGLAASL
jgi:hypothetical protein